MVQVNFYEHAPDDLLRFAVIIARSKGKWVLCKHRERDTLEVPGGHREPGESIDDAAARELQEETGAIDFRITPICVYSAIAPDNFDGKETFGKLFYAEIDTFAPQLHSEIERVFLLDELPENWTYPLIQPKLIEEVQRRGFLALTESEKNEMSITYQRLTDRELDSFIQLRIRQLREEGAKEDIDLTPALLDYYHRHMADGTFVSWLALDGDRIVGTSGMSFVEKPPYFGCPNGKIGLLSSMYTDPAYRRRGIGKELLSRVVEEARRYGCGSVQITASDMGVLLYTDFGFKRNGNFMQYKL